MTTDAIGEVIATREALRAIVGEPADLVMRKDIGRLDEHCRAFIARSPFVLVGTSGADGFCDVSPRGDAPGFARVLDERTLVLPERPGNKRTDTLTNIIDNPQVGLLFLVPGVEETLRVNGRARVVRDSALLASMAVNNKPPLLAIVVEVRESYLHCAKAFKRARLWDADSQVLRTELPSLARIIYDQLQLDCELDDLERGLAEGYKKLY